LQPNINTFSKMSTFNKNHIASLLLLDAATTMATRNGLFDQLSGYVAPDSIYDFNQGVDTCINGLEEFFTAGNDEKEDDFFCIDANGSFWVLGKQLSSIEAQKSAKQMQLVPLVILNMEKALLLIKQIGASGLQQPRTTHLGA
jgi:hypothetical protein